MVNIAACYQRGPEFKFPQGRESLLIMNKNKFLMKKKIFLLIGPMNFDLFWYNMFLNILYAPL